MAQGRRSLEQEEELRNLLTTANLSRMRGKWLDAEDAYRKALSISPNDAKVRGMLVDVLVEVGKIDQAITEVKAAMELSPGNVALETKHAKLVLQRGEESYSTAHAQDMLAHPERYLQHKQQKPMLSILLAIVVPGLAQLYNHQIVKAGIIFGTFFLFIVSYTFLQPPYPQGMITKGEFIRYTNPVVEVLAIVAIMAYVYGILDAAMGGGKKEDKSKSKEEDWKRKLLDDLK